MISVHVINRMSETQKEPQICLIIVNWNNYEDTIACLESVVATGNKNKIVIIDNGSHDSSVQKISQWASDRNIKHQIVSCYLETGISIGSDDVILTLISLYENRGFAAANNEGIRFAVRHNADFVLLLNNDTVIKNDLFMKLSKTIQDVKNAGIIGCKIRNFSAAERIWFSGGRINFILGAFYHRKDECTTIRETDFVTGCFMLIPIEIFENVGLLNEIFFLNVEDIDFSCRVKDAGYKLFVNCGTEIYHKISSTIGGLQSSRNQYYFHRNRMLFFDQRLSGIKKIIFFTFQWVCAIPVWMMIQFIKGNKQALKGAIYGYFDYCSGVYGKSRYF